jgi:hypothetical protein
MSQTAPLTQITTPKTHPEQQQQPIQQLTSPTRQPAALADNSLSIMPSCYNNKFYLYPAMWIVNSRSPGEWL